jgi:hypothetical protein
MLADFLNLTTDVLAACCGDQPKPPANGAFAAGWWTATVPGKRLVPFLKDYADNGETIVARATDGRELASGRVIGRPVPRDEVLEVQVEYSFLGGVKERHTVSIPYPRPEVRSLCIGEWTTFGKGEARMSPTALFPRATPILKGKDAGIHVYWEKPVTVRYRGWGRFKLFHRLLSAEVWGFNVYEDTVEVLAKGFLVNQALPRVVLA